ncbi:MAG: class I SAM-dependent methyltransferase [Rubripirellula sp.]|nr:class I SAM-dependent methyltransferase [Rubripirellula sp.]
MSYSPQSSGIESRQVSIDNQQVSNVPRSAQSTSLSERIYQLDRLLDQVRGEISSAASPYEIQRGVDQLFKGLRTLRRDASRNEWTQLIDRGRKHSLRQIVHEDPFTRRAFEKPRGYAGDAVMMDYIYSQDDDSFVPEASPMGRAIFQYTASAPASAGVRERRHHVANLLDDLGSQSPGRDVLAIACGHLREANVSSEVRSEKFGRFVALDADPESLDEVEARYGQFGIQPIQADVRRMLTGRTDLGSFDLIYSTGLFDYLNDSIARRLTMNLFRDLRPGGRLVVANFLPEIRDVGYMEMFMDWHLVYRSRTDMLSLADAIDESELKEVRIQSEVNQNIIFLELTKR